MVEDKKRARLEKTAKEHMRAAWAVARDEAGEAGPTAAGALWRGHSALIPACQQPLLVKQGLKLDEAAIVESLGLLVEQALEAKLLQTAHLGRELGAYDSFSRALAERIAAGFVPVGQGGRDE